jgi:hypothetical protein
MFSAGESAAMRFVTVLLGCLYGLMGLGSVVPFAMLVVYGPSITPDVASLPALVWYAVPLLNAVASFIVACGFLLLRRWGRGAAMIYNGFGLVALAIGLAYSRLVEAPAASWTSGATMFFVAGAGFLVGVIVLCSTERAKELMRTGGHG